MIINIKLNNTAANNIPTVGHKQFQVFLFDSKNRLIFYNIFIYMPIE